MPLAIDKKIIHKTDETVNTLTPPLYFVSALLLHIFYFLVFFGLYSVNTVYIRYLSTFIQVLISAFLIYRFNPLRKMVMHHHDGVIFFSSGVFLLTNTVFTETFISKIEGKVEYLFPWIKPYLHSVKDVSKDSKDSKDSS